MTSCAEEARLYIFNYVRDFFRASSITLDFFFNFKKRDNIDSQSFQNLVWKLRLYHGTKKHKHVEHQLDTSNYADYVYRIGNRKFTFKK